MRPLLPQSIKPQQQFDLYIFRNEVHTSISIINTEQQNVFTEIIDAILPGFTASNAIYTIPSATANSNQSQSTLHQTSSSHSLCNPTPHFPSSFHLHSLYSSRLFHWVSAEGTGENFFRKSIQCFLHLRFKKCHCGSNLSSGISAPPWRTTTHYISKIQIPCIESYSCNVPAKVNLATNLQNVYFIIWNQILMCLRYSNDEDDSTMRDLTWSERPLEEKSYCSLETFHKSLPFSKLGQGANF